MCGSSPWLRPTGRDEPWVFLDTLTSAVTQTQLEVFIKAVKTVSTGVSEKMRWQIVRASWSSIVPRAVCSSASGGPKPNPPSM